MESDIHEVTHPETGEVMQHYEWNGWLWCENEQEPFDFDQGDITCPHCGDSFNSYE